MFGGKANLKAVVMARLAEKAKKEPVRGVISSPGVVGCLVRRWWPRGCT